MPTTADQWQFTFQPPDKAAAAAKPIVATAAKHTQCQSLKETAPAWPFSSPGVESISTASQTNNQVKAREAAEDLFSTQTPPPFRAPEFNIAADKIRQLKQEILAAAQRRYDDEIEVFALCAQALQSISTQIKRKEQAALLKTALSNLPTAWAVLLGREASTTTSMKDAEDSRPLTYARAASSNTSVSTETTAKPTLLETRESVPKPPAEDRRILIRVPDGRADEFTSYGVKKHLTDTLKLKPTQLLDAHRIRTGWAVLADTIETRNTILSAQADWLSALGAEKADANETWYTYVVDNAPRHLSDVNGRSVTLMAAAQDEIVAQTGLVPVDYHIRRKDDGSSPSTTLVVSFRQQPARPWRLFGITSLARMIRGRIDKRSMPPLHADCPDPRSADDGCFYAEPAERTDTVMNLSKHRRPETGRHRSRDSDVTTSRPTSGYATSATPPGRR